MFLLAKKHEALFQFVKDRDRLEKVIVMEDSS